jgi:hypothetical protein
MTSSAGSAFVYLTYLGSSGIDLVARYGRTARAARIAGAHHGVGPKSNILVPWASDRLNPNRLATRVRGRGEGLLPSGDAAARSAVVSFGEQTLTPH